MTTTEHRSVPLAEHVTIPASEMRDFARVLKASLLMIVRYLEKRYHV